jgi:hypothetical protein
MLLALLLLLRLLRLLLLLPLYPGTEEARDLVGAHHQVPGVLSP